MCQALYQAPELNELISSSQPACEVSTVVTTHFTEKKPGGQIRGGLTIRTIARSPFIIMTFIRIHHMICILLFSPTPINPTPIQNIGENTKVLFSTFGVRMKCWTLFTNLG